MALSEIGLYKKIDDQLIEEAGIKYEVPVLSFTDSDGQISEIENTGSTDTSLVIEDSNWSPQDNNLIYKQNFYVEHPDALFGMDKITDSDNKIGMAVHIYSKTSYFQETLVCSGEVTDTSKEITLKFEHEFKRATLRGRIYLEFFFYLKELNSPTFFQADSVGLNLCQKNIFETQISVDGDGAMFPITQASIPDGPLWTVKKLWSDPSTDSFDTSNVQIELNTKHPLLERVVAGKQAMSREVMANIMVQSISMIIAQTISDMKEQDLDFDDDYDDESIMGVVHGWIVQYDVNTENMMTILESLQNSELRTNIEQAGKDDD